MSSGQQTSKPDLYVIARIIKSLMENGSTKKTALATSTGLAYDRLSKYVDWMAERNLVTTDEDGRVHLTQAGAETYQDLVAWIMKFVGKLKFPRFDH